MSRQIKVQEQVMEDDNLTFKSGYNCSINTNSGPYINNVSHRNMLPLKQVHYLSMFTIIGYS